MKKIVVIGGGTMGLDIAQVFAKKGFDVVVRDINDDIIKASEARLNKSPRQAGIQGQAGRGGQGRHHRQDDLHHRPEHGR